MTIIEINDLCFQYYGKKQYALKNINFILHNDEKCLEKENF